MNIKIYSYIKTNFYIEIIFLLIVSFFAIYSTNGHTIAWGVLPLLYVIQKSGVLTKTTKKDIAFGLIIFAIIFIFNFLHLYNFETNKINLTFDDYNYYVKIASVFNQTGAENYYTSKNILFKDLNLAGISTQYRFFDIWLIAFFLKFMPFSDLAILQLFYMPFIYSLVSFSVYKNIDFKNKWIKIIGSILFLFLFGDWLFTKILKSDYEFVSWYCLIALPKLAIFFSVFLYFFKSQYKKETQADGILYLAFLPILIQVSFPIYIFIYLYILYYYKHFIFNKKIAIAIVLSTIYYLLFYIYNTQQLDKVFEIKQYHTVHSFSQYIKRLISISFHFLTNKTIIFSLISLTFIYFLPVEKVKINLRILLISILIFIPGLFVYTFFPDTPNSSQFLTNFLCPSLICATFTIWINAINTFSIKYYKINLGILFIMAFLGIYYQINNNVFFGGRSQKEDKFIDQTKIMLKNIKSPIGITYWDKNFHGNNGFGNTEVFSQYGTNFLIALGANYDVVNLSASNFDSIEKVNNLNIYYSAVNMFQRKEKITKNVNEIFYDKYKFEFLITNLKSKQLPGFIKDKIIAFTYNPDTKIYCYRLIIK